MMISFRMLRIIVVISILFSSCDKSYDVELIANNVIDKQLNRTLNGYKISPIDRGIEQTYFRFPNGAEYYVCLLYTSPSPRDRG